MEILQQNDSRWGSLPYNWPGSSGNTIATSGCGPSSFCNVYNALTNGNKLIPEFITFSLNHGYRVNGGTLNSFMKGAADAYGLNYEASSDVNYVIQRVKEGAMATLVTSGRSGFKGIFTSGGHFISLQGYTDDGYFVVGDSYFYKGKFTATANRKAAVANKQLAYDETKKLIWCKPDLIHSENSYKLYWILSTNTKPEEDMTEQQVRDIVKDEYLKMMTDQADDASDWAKQTSETAVALGITDGTNPGAYTTREQVWAMLIRLLRGTTDNVSDWAQAAWKELGPDGLKAFSQEDPKALVNKEILATILQRLKDGYFCTCKK